MLFAERTQLQVALLENCLVIGGADGRRSKAGLKAEVLNLPLAAPQAPAWQPAVAALSGWLRERGLQRAHLRVFLSSQLVRWQLLEWQPQLTRPQELEAYVHLRFRATFGAAADSWRVVHTEPLPGRALPACAIDEALLAELQALGSIGQTKVSSVVPYFSAAFDRWRGSLGHQVAWFGVIEPGSLTLGLLHRGVWRGLRSARHAQPSASGWRSLLPALQAQIQLASGIELDKAPPVYLVGCGGGAGDRREAGVVWLAAEGGGPSGVERMAWGI
ncbi:hypothetical protein [Hydrogenophaga sp.]|uniref:hypothetical protein n=1 Tax=Hydrogenophaga sp. TaxID=1904254 RepID=UPI0025C3E2BB|nr:hypothetical protein [Hydrogenophaga sp.]MBT9463078.1 hypothetical protein [Hydrogenophaga sp.]